MTDQRPIVFLDTETTGLHHDRRPWEIAWIRREVDGAETERCIQIADVDLTDAQPEGLAIGGFHERWRGGPDTAATAAMESINWRMGLGGTRGNESTLNDFDAAHEVWRATRNAIIVGINPRFDTETLDAMFRRHKLCAPWYYQLVDVTAFAAGWLTSNSALVPASDALQEKRMERYAVELQLRDAHLSGDLEKIQDAEKAVCDSMEIEDREWRKCAAEFVAPPWRSDDLSRACGVEPPADEERHTALGDARWVKRWYDHILGGAA